MLYTFLISVVFIAEIIIVITMFQCLLKLDKKIISLDELLNLVKPKIKDISVLIKNISEQSVELTNQNIEQFKNNQEVAFSKLVLKVLISLLLCKLNINVINKIRKSKLLKKIGKGLSLLEIMV
ncbi:MAG: hypothetical protein E7Z89_01245 [Cyanobacteria bacterium SIG28]|nr:hypothetical protein [Cyanobacteria bacterium SIG28]